MKKRQNDHEQSIEKSNSPVEELADEQLEQVNGGLNPQPLPPGASRLFRLKNENIQQGIIIVSGYQE